MSAVLVDGRWFRVLTVIDQFTRECLALVADSALNGHSVAEALSQLVAERSTPESMTADNGIEFASKRWARGPTDTVCGSSLYVRENWSTMAISNRSTAGSAMSV
jgi:putative transposase